MENKTISYTYAKNGKKWHLVTTELDPCLVSFNLLQSIIAKKFHKCTYISKIIEIRLYTGYRKFVVYYDNNYKTVYTIPDSSSNYLLNMSEYIPFNN